MITFILLMVITLFLIGFVVTIVGLGGSIFLILASDIIVAGAIIWFIYYLIKKKKK